MSTSSASMLPPDSMHRHHHHLNGNRLKSDVDSANGNTPDVSTTPTNANLAEESMMVLSQSIDSIHAIGTSAGSDGLDHQVRTLFVSGLPLDAKSRELYLLFRGFKGYVSSTLKPAGKNGKLTAPVGFVTFDTREQAEDALNELQGVKFDPEGNQHMRLEFARSNTKVTRPKWPPGIPMPPGVAAAGYPFIPAGGTGAGLSPMGQHSGFPGVISSGFLPQLAGFDTTTMALIAAQDPTQWATSGTHFGFDSASLFNSIAAAQGLAPAALLQASNFRQMLPMSAGSVTPGSQSGAMSANNHIQLMQAALQATNAAAALGLMTPGSTGIGSQQQTGQTSASTGRSPQGSSPPTGAATPLVTACQNPASQAVYTTQAHQQQQHYLAAAQQEYHHQHQQHHQQQQQQEQQQRQQQAVVAAAAAGMGMLLPGMLGGYSTASAVVKDDINGNAVSFAFQN